MTMTKAELLALPPGPELDREIYLLLYGHETNASGYPYYSVNANVAMRVWQERFVEKGWRIFFDGNKWCVARLKWEGTWNEIVFVSAHTVAHAICRAIIEEMME